MCCCDVSTCCCGCNNLQRGTFIWAIVDAVLNFVLFVATAAPLGGASPTWISFGMVFWDILLAIGTHFRISGLLVVWQIFMMIYIIILFAMWIVIPALLVLTIFVSAAAAADASSTLSNINGVTVPSVSTATATTATTAAAGAVAVFCLVFAIVLPIVYIYFWIVVNNLRREFSRPAPAQVQMTTYPQTTYY